MRRLRYPPRDGKLCASWRDIVRVTGWRSNDLTGLGHAVHKATAAYFERGV